MNTYEVTLTQEEREQLIEVTRTGTHTARKIVHALILLNVDRGQHAAERQTNEEICRVLKIGMRTIDHPRDMPDGPCDYWQTSLLNFGLQRAFHTKRSVEH